MNERERRSDVPGGPGDPTSSERSAGNLAELRELGEKLLSAGEDAISRALSGDSVEFLAASRQRGGE
jgi:hypothetical protein